MVKRSHAQDPATLTIRPLGGFEHPHLNDHRQRLRQEHTAHQQQGPQAVREQRHRAQGRSHRQGSRVPHEGTGWMTVVHQKAQPGAGHGHAEARQGRVAAVAAEHQLQGQPAEHQGAAPTRQTIQAVGEVGGVAFREKDEETQRPDRQPQGQGPTERQAHAAADPALPAGDSQKTHSCDALEQQFASGCQTGVRLLGETAPVVKAADHHERQGDAADGDQLNRSGSFDTDPAAEDHPHRNHQQPPHRGGSGLGLMTAGPLGPNHLAHLQCSQPGNADGRCQRCGDGGGQQRQGQLAVGDPFV